MSICVGNKVMSGEEFAQEVQRDTATDLCCVTGAAKRSGSGCDGEILFTQDAQGESWAKIPTQMIESVEVLSRTSIGGEACHLVKLYLKTPHHPESAVLSQLLAQRESGERRSGAALLANDGVLPLRVNDGVPPLGFIAPNNGGTLPLGFIVLNNGGTLPLRIGDGLIILGWRVGN